MIEKQYLIPNNLDLIQLITEKVGEKHLKHLPKYLYFINCYYLLRNQNKENTKNSWINISATQLREVVGITIPVSKNLVEWGVFEKNHQYKAGEFSKSYRLTEQYRDMRATVFTCSEEIAKKFEKKLSIVMTNNSKRKENKTTDLLHLPEYRFLQSSLLNIQIDHLEAKKYISWCLEKQIQLKDKDVKTKNFTYTLKNRVFNEEIYNSFLSSISLIKEGKTNIKIDEFSGRLYSYVTNLPNLLLPFVQIKNHTTLEEKLVEIDIKCSQPYFLIKFLEDKFKNHTTLEEKCTPIPPNVVWFSEIEKLKTLYYNDLYQSIADAINISREEAKHLFFAGYLFSKVSTKSKVRDYMTSNFPLVTQMIDSYKEKGLDYLPIQLSRLESKCVINTIVKRLSIEHSDCFVITKHDCLITTSSMVDEVYNIMIEELERFTQVPVRLKTKLFELPQFEYSGNEIEDNTYKYEVLAEEFISETNEQITEDKVIKILYDENGEVKGLLLLSDLLKDDYEYCVAHQAFLTEENDKLREELRKEKATNQKEELNKQLWDFFHDIDEDFARKITGREEDRKSYSDFSELPF